MCEQSGSVEAVSGDREGGVRLWRLVSGTCVHRLTAHAAPISAVLLTKSLIISAGLDDHVYVWDRVRGYLVNCLSTVGHLV